MTLNFGPLNQMRYVYMLEIQKELTVGRFSNSMTLPSVGFPKAILVRFTGGSTASRRKSKFAVRGNRDELAWRTTYFPA